MAGSGFGFEPYALRIVVIASIAGAIATSFMLYHQYSEYVETSGKTFQDILDESNALRERMAAVESFLGSAAVDDMAGCSDHSMAYVEVSNFSVSGLETRAIMFENSGDCPLTSFEASLNGARIEPYYAPEMVTAGRMGMVVLQPAQATEWHATEGVVKLESGSGAAIEVKTASTATGITGYSLMAGGG